MPIAPVRLFNPEMENVRSLKGIDLVSAFNDGILPTVNSLFPSLDAGDPLDIGAATSDLDQQASDYADDWTNTLTRDTELLFSRSGRNPISVPSPAYAMESPAPQSPDSAETGVEYDGSRDLLSIVKEFEGFNPKAYSDYKQTSIGYGTRAKKGERSISKEEAEIRLQQELAVHRKRVEDHVAKHGYKFTTNQLDALTSFDYNTGRIEELTAGGKRTPEQIAAKIPAYNKAGGEVVKGLVKRRAQEQRLFTQE